MTSPSNSSQSTRPIGRVLWEELLVPSDFTHNYERMSGIFVPSGHNELTSKENLLF